MHFSYILLSLVARLLLQSCNAIDCPVGCIDEQPPNQPHSCQVLAQDFDACGTRTTGGDRYCKCSCQTCPGQSRPQAASPPPLAQEGWVFIDSTQQSIQPPKASMESLPVQNSSQIVTGVSETPVAYSIRGVAKPSDPSLASIPLDMDLDTSLDTVGLAVGGARGIDTFRRSIENGELPSIADLTYEGVFNDYFFDITDGETCTQLFCAKYSGAITSDPLFPSDKKEFYLGIGLESGQKAATFKRKDLDLVIVLDISGSMGSEFGDFASSNPADKGLKKIDVAKQAIKNMMKHLTPSDKMAIVTFASNAKVHVDLGFVTPDFVSATYGKVDSIRVGGMTNLEDGLRVAAGLMQKDTRENRLVVVTDANANKGEYREVALAKIIRGFAVAQDPIFTSLIGVGLDFNSDLTNSILRTKGANYFTVYSPEELRKKLDEEFEFMVSPFIFDLALEFDPNSLNGDDGWKIIQAFGVPADAAGVQSNGEILEVSTLFPSPKTSEGTKGGIILLHIKQKNNNPKPLYIKVSYMDNDFWLYAGTSEVTLFQDTTVEFFGSDAIRKAILLTRYVDVLKFWLNGVSGNQLVVSQESADDFIAFLAYMNEQKKVLQDSRLDRESDLLRKLIVFGA